MNKPIAIILTAVVASFCLPSSYASDTVLHTNWLTRIGCDDGNAGPRRDELGPDSISYDDGYGRRFYSHTNYWVRVRFTPDSRFQIYAVRFKPLNQGENYDDPCHVQIWTEDQDHNLDEMVWEGTIDELGGPDLTWETLELDENDRYIFDADEDFTIVYGSVPGGNYSDPLQQGEGWWCLLDDVSRDHRSYITGSDQADPPVAHSDWFQIDGDLLLRANGMNLENYVEIGAIELHNGDPDQIRLGQWMMYPGTEQTLKARLTNYGDDIDEYVVTFTVDDPNGDQIFSSNVVVQNHAAGDTISVECPDVWQAPETTGRYTAWLEVTAAEDANEDNNRIGLDQVVFQPDEGTWLGFTDGEPESFTRWNEDSGWALWVTHPGGDQALWLTDFRVMVAPENAQRYNPEFSVRWVALEDGFITAGPTVIWSGSASTDGTADAQWVDVNLDPGDYVTMHENEGIIVTYHYVNGVLITIDGTPPLAGSNLYMPFCMVETADDGVGYYWNDVGDFLIDVKLGNSDEAPSGPHLRIEPDTLDIGYGLPRAQDVPFPTLFISYGDAPVSVSDITLSDTAQAFFNVAPTDFEVAPGETTIVNVTFNADTLIDFDTNFLVVSDAENFNNGRYSWPVHASTMNAVIKADVDEIDFGDNLSTGTDYGVDVTFSNPALVQVSVSDIRLPQEYEDILTVAPDVFDILPGEQIVWRVTLHTQEIIDLNTEITLVNDSQNDPEMVFAVHAGVTGVSNGEHPVIPLGWSLAQNNPNPFNPTTTVEFTTLKGSVVDLAVYDMSGRRLLDVFHGYLPAGYHSAEINAMNIPAGIYLYRVAAGEFSAARKMVLMR